MAFHEMKHPASAPLLYIRNNERKTTGLSDQDIEQPGPAKAPVLAQLSYPEKLKQIKDYWFISPRSTTSSS